MKTPRSSKRAPRIRRTAENARTEILDAAERQLAAVGPGGIRLQDVARDVGVSHPTVLHHFGSREGLVRAVVTRSIAALNKDITTALAEAPEGPAGAAAMLDRVAATLGSESHARSLAWLSLSDEGLPADIGRIETVIDALHARRTTLRTRQRKPPPSREDSVFAVLLIVFAFGGEAIQGRALYPSAGLADTKQGSTAFRVWFGNVLVDYLTR
jgi:AcrR family transcriptional regulator